MNTNCNIRPFIKWAGGKNKLYDQLFTKLPSELNTGEIKNYYEPFLGSGAVFLRLIQKFSFQNIFLSDINEELILVYKVVQRDVNELINYLDEYKFKYFKLDNKQKEEFYYEMRNSYNIQRFNINHKTFSNLWIPRAAQMIFLNKLCYNGLFRQNLLGAFNVPFGKNYNPEIFDEINLFKISELLKNVEINTYDFHLSCKEIKTDSFVYLDPPYMPLSATSKFTHYCSSNFTLKDHIRVTELISTLNHNNVKFMLTNSTTFNDELIKDKYSDFKFSFINASRMMSSRIEKRGFVTEVIITNY